MHNLVGGWVDQSRRFKSSLSGSDGGSVRCGPKRKLPGHITSFLPFAVKGGHVIPNPVLSLLNLATIGGPSLIGLCTSEWGLTPSDRTTAVWMGKPIIVIKLHEKTLAVGLTCESESAPVEIEYLPKLSCFISLENHLSTNLKLDKDVKGSEALLNDCS
ncbi:hypothetical protein JRO89_XS02G0090700 [Xanthoceras sorbifolium]|uniref:Uncharacterized protein n=1 Tax=Xanthoceras sorbifolium TaxID=99658 RepID=A0ABQ8IFD0_9ROSI|nr:hypothetical protein JRO89_XS02G0090700 [Xanthoceras sorbifolium]